MGERSIEIDICWAVHVSQYKTTRRRCWKQRCECNFVNTCLKKRLKVSNWVSEWHWVFSWNELFGLTTRATENKDVQREGERVSVAWARLQRQRPNSSSAQARYQKLIIVNNFILHWSKYEHFIIVIFVRLVLCANARVFCWIWTLITCDQFEKDFTLNVNTVLTIAKKALTHGVVVVQISVSSMTNGWQNWLSIYMMERFKKTLFTREILF